MTRLLRFLFTREIIAAMRLGAFADWWGAKAARRLGKVSGGKVSAGGRE